MSDKMFYPISSKLMCHNMKLTTLNDVLRSIENIDSGKAFEIKMTDEEIAQSRKCIDEMIRLGNA